MHLRGVDFGPVWDASGVRGFFGGDEYLHHKVFKHLPGFSFDGSTFVAKTTTLLARQGNMPLGGRDGLTPQEWKPRCIVVKPFRGAVLNAVGLSGPGAAALFEAGRWQLRFKPFFLSFMSVAPAADERLAELRLFVMMLKSRLPSFLAPVGLQINYSCPNVGLHRDDLISEIRVGLDAAAELGIPVVIKLSVVIPPQVARVLAEHAACDALCVSNTVPWGQFPERIDWKGLFGSEVSPLADLGGGGLSGAPIFPLVKAWLSEIRDLGCPKPINVGGGLLKPKDVYQLFAAGAHSVFIGSMAILRPWNVQPSIQAAYRYHQLTKGV